MKRFLKTSEIRFPILKLNSLLSVFVGVMIGFTSEAIHLQASARSRNVPVRFSPPLPPERGAPGRRSQAASRSCNPNEKALTALVPTWETTVKPPQQETIRVIHVLGLTTQAQPTLWFFVPKAMISSVEFSLQNEAGKDLYRTRLTPPDRAGIVPVQLPATATLETNQKYRWFFKMKFQCNPTRPVQSAHTEGWIQRVDSAGLVDRLKQATPEERAALYAEKGYWFDTVTALAELRLANPNDAEVAANWTNLLKGVDLEALSKQPIVR
jgi:hypothetical protein